MDIELLSRMVGELIVDHDMVGLPGVGTFVAEVVPATFSDKGYTINPPYRRLSFHPSKGEEDLLVDLYSVTNGINREAARIYLTQFLQEMKSVLKDRKTIVFPGLGRMRATKENNFFFIQDQEIDIFPNGYALPAVSLKAQQDDPEPVRISVPPIVLTPDLQSAQPDPEPLEALQPEPLSQEQTEMPQERTEAPQAQSELQPEPQEEPESEPEPLETLQAQPEPEPQEEPEPEPEPLPQTEEPQAQPEMLQEELEPLPQPEPEEAVDGSVAVEQDPILEFADEPAPEPEPAPMPAPRPQPAKFAETAARTTTTPTKQHLWWVPVVIILALAMTAFAVFLILAEVAPDFIDSILYTPEELRIINY